METFKCECCQGNFQALPPDTQVQDEVEPLYRACVCEECYQQIMKFEYEYV